MARLAKEQLFSVVEDAIRESGWYFLCLPSFEIHPARYQLYRDDQSYRVRVYIWNLTPGGQIGRCRICALQQRRRFWKPPSISGRRKAAGRLRAARRGQQRRRLGSRSGGGPDGDSTGAVSRARNATTPPADGLTGRRTAADTRPLVIPAVGLPVGRIVVQARIANLSGEGGSARGDALADTGAGAPISRTG